MYARLEGFVESADPISGQDENTSVVFQPAIQSIVSICTMDDRSTCVQGFLHSQEDRHGRVPAVVFLRPLCHEYVGFVE